MHIDKYIIPEIIFAKIKPCKPKVFMKKGVMIRNKPELIIEGYIKN